MISSLLGHSFSLSLSSLFIFNFTSPNIYIQSSSMKISDDVVCVRLLLLYPPVAGTVAVDYLSHPSFSMLLKSKTRGKFLGILKLRTTHQSKDTHHQSSFVKRRRKSVTLSHTHTDWCHNLFLCWKRVSEEERERK